MAEHHAHWDGFYPLGKDTTEILEGLEKHGQGTKTAKALEHVLRHLPKYLSKICLGPFGERLGCP